MARVRDVEIGDVPETAREVYRRYGTEYGPFLNQVKVFAHRPAALRHLMGMLMEMNDDPVLDKRHLEIALVAVSRLNACEYCIVHHTPRAVEHGLSAAACEAILETEVPGFDALDTLVRDYAVAVTNDFQTIREATFDALRAHFSDTQIVELTLRIALCGFFNRMNDALQIGLEEDAMTAMQAAGTART